MTLLEACHRRVVCCKGWSCLEQCVLCQTGHPPLDSIYRPCVDRCDQPGKSLCHCFSSEAPQPLPVTPSCWGVSRLASTAPTLVAASPVNCYRQRGLPCGLTVPAGPAVPGGVISKANVSTPCTKPETRSGQICLDRASSVLTSQNLVSQSQSRIPSEPTRRTSGDSKQTDAAEPIKEWAYLSDEEMMLYAKRQLGSLISHTLLAKLSRRELVALLSRERHASSPQTVVRLKGGDHVWPSKRHHHEVSTSIYSLRCSKTTRSPGLRAVAKAPPSS